MDENEFPTVITIVIVMIIVLMAAIVIALLFFIVLPAQSGGQETTTTTILVDDTTTTSTVSTTTTTSILTTSTTTSTTTTTTVKVFLCNSELKKTEFIMTECYSKNEKEYFNKSMSCYVEYMLNNTIQQDYTSNRVNVKEDTCYYVAKKISFTRGVGSFVTCEIPQKKNTTVIAQVSTQ